MPFCGFQRMGIFHNECGAARVVPKEIRVRINESTDVGCGSRPAAFWR